MELRYGFHPSPFGSAIVISSERGLAGLAFSDPGEERPAFEDMARRWPRATLIADQAGTAAMARRIFDANLWNPEQPLRVLLIGTDFEVRVWETLLKIPMGRAVCYSDIASNIDSPKASRAVGAAVVTPRAIGPAEARVLLSAAAALLILAAVGLLWPRLLAVPLAVLGGWAGLSLLVRAGALYRQRDQ